MSTPNNYFTQMLQRVMIEAQSIPLKQDSTGALDLVIPKNKNPIPSNPSPPEESEKFRKVIDDSVKAKKRLNLEKTIQKLKDNLDKKQQQNAEMITVDDEPECSESGDDVDVVGGSGPTAAEINTGIEDVVEINPDAPHPYQRPQIHPNECPYCGKILASPNLQKEHVAIMHLNERNFACEMCSARFGRRGGLRRHMQMVHSNHIYKCTYDGCTHPGYKCSKALQAHVRSVHTKERPFICENCDKTFVRKNDLVMHSKTHIKEPSHSCVCGTRFRRVVYLKKHQKTCYAAASALASGLPTEIRNYEDEQELNIEMVKQAQEELINKGVKLDAKAFFPDAKVEDPECLIIGVRQNPPEPSTKSMEGDFPPIEEHMEDAAIPNDPEMPIEKIEA